ncbi:MAG: hypothetical protein KAS88_04880 [Deltaproteobacteria bacterium]|nr:hypothetical protein [Deltaproteobacteria bacterium]
MNEGVVMYPIMADPSMLSGGRFSLTGAIKALDRITAATKVFPKHFVGHSPALERALNPMKNSLLNKLKMPAFDKLRNVAMDRFKAATITNPCGGTALGMSMIETRALYESAAMRLVRESQEAHRIYEKITPAFATTDLLKSSAFYAVRKFEPPVERSAPQVIFKRDQQEAFPLKEVEGNSEYRQVMNSVCDLILECNFKANGYAMSDIFKPTNKFSQAIHALPNIFAEDRRTLGEFVGYLYTILCEKDNRENVRREALYNKLPLEDILFLRDKEFAHDIEHDRPVELKKKRIKLRELYCRYINKSYPENKEDFQKLQLALTRAVESMLQKVFENIGSSKENFNSDHSSIH